jgi:glycosyltransferase involved in cell wall biosynthesis
MSETPKVTVVTSTWKRPRTLFKHAIKSVEIQTYPNIEHLIVVDGWDATLMGMLKKAGYAYDKNPKKRITFLGRNWTSMSDDGGAGATARMVGAWMASGEYITYLDDDNDYAPKHIEQSVNAIVEAKVDLLCSTWIYYNGLIGGGTPLKVGAVDTSAIMHKAELLKLGSWELDGYTGDGLMVERWVERGCTWAFRNEPTMKLNPYRHGAPDFE